jgi:hypothetical protein
MPELDKLLAHAKLARKRWLRGQAAEESALRRNLLNNYLRCKFKVLHNREGYLSELDAYSELDNPAWLVVKRAFDSFLYELPPDEYNDVARHLNKSFRGAKLLIIDWYGGNKNDN